MSEGAIRRLPKDERQRYLWGDDESRHVIDWYYLASPELLVSIHVLTPGARYAHSEKHKSFYIADECYYLLRGELTFHDPESGEVHTVRAGETLHFRAGTWHHGYNFGTETCEILVAFAPLPPDITAAADISKLATPLSTIRGGRYELLGDFPWSRLAAPRTGDRIVKLRPDDWLELIHGEAQPVRVQLFVSTDKLTMGRITLLPCGVTDVASHPGDLVRLVTDGWAGVFEHGHSDWVELHREDGVLIPGGTPYRLMNMTDRPSEFVFGAARYHRAELAQPSRRVMARHRERPDREPGRPSRLLEESKFRLGIDRVVTMLGHELRMPFEHVFTRARRRSDAGRE